MGDVGRVVIRCSRCDASWSGWDEYEAESKASQFPCQCMEELENLSYEELLALYAKKRREE